MIVHEKVLDKVTAFITRETANGRELLYLRHPLAGIQLPAGTVEDGESPELAVRRETEEETGLQNVSIAAYLGRLTLTLPPDERVLLRDSPLSSMPATDATLVRGGMQRGELLKVLDEQGNYLRVHYRKVIIRDGETKEFNRKGWLASEVVTNQIVRHLFHLQVVGECRDSWTQRSDHNFEFGLFWSPIDVDPGLHPAQQEWMVAARKAGL